MDLDFVTVLEWKENFILYPKKHGSLFTPCQSSSFADVGNIKNFVKSGVLSVHNFNMTLTFFQLSYRKRRSVKICDKSRY